MSPRIIHLPLSGRDRRHYVRELRAAEQAHREMPGRVEEAYRAAHRLACQEWSVRQFLGGPAGAVAQDRRCDCWRLRPASRWRPMEFSHLIILVGAVLVVLGLVAFAYSDDPA
jgi:hypothetical protein